MAIYDHNPRWCKNESNKRISGVCSGLAQRFGFPVWSTRLVTVLLFISMPLLVSIAYLVAHCSLPSRVY